MEMVVPGTPTLTYCDNVQKQKRLVLWMLVCYGCLSMLECYG